MFVLPRRRINNAIQLGGRYGSLITAPRQQLTRFVMSGHKFYFGKVTGLTLLDRLHQLKKKNEQDKIFNNQVASVVGGQSSYPLLLVQTRLSSSVNSNKTKKSNSHAPPLSWTTVQRALIGNSLITLLKFGVYFQTGSSAMLSEAIHTLADSGNQALLLAGLHQSSNAPDRRFQYGYGRAAFFWSLISALGMFWTGAGVTIFHGMYNMLHPELHTVEMSTPSLWGVLLFSFAVDGYVLGATLKELQATKPENVSLYRYLRTLRDPFVLSVILEDFTACTGVLIASVGIGAAYVTGNTFWDAAASIGIGALLGIVALRLVRMNQQYLLGQAIDNETVRQISKILENKTSVEAVYGIQSQWVGPSSFSFKVEVDFDGTYLASRLEDKYAPLFTKASDQQEVEVLMSWFAEDVTRLVEREVYDIEESIRERFPQAAYIEIEPQSKYANVDALPEDPRTHSPQFKLEKKEMDKLEEKF